MGWRREIRERIAELEHQRLRLEEQRRRAKVHEISHHIDDLWASLK
jgi:hypothetical protein